MAWKYQDNSRGNQRLSARDSPILSPSQSISGQNCSEIKYLYLPNKDHQKLPVPIIFMNRINNVLSKFQCLINMYRMHMTI